MHLHLNRKWPDAETITFVVLVLLIVFAFTY
jgi:hypothetical protein